MRVLAQLLIILSVPGLIVGLIFEYLPKISPQVAHTLAQNAPYAVAGIFYALMVWGLGYWISGREINSKGYFHG